MTVTREAAYHEKVIVAAKLKEVIERMRQEASEENGMPLKVFRVTLKPVVAEQREVYDVVVTMVPDAPAHQSPEIIDGEPSI